MVAALILLDCGLTFRAWLGVGLNPFDVLAVRLFLLQPHRHLAAVARLVVLLAAEDAVRVAAQAIDRNDICRGRDLR